MGRRGRGRSRARKVVGVWEWLLGSGNALVVVAVEKKRPQKRLLHAHDRRRARQQCSQQPLPQAPLPQRAHWRWGGWPQGAAARMQQLCLGAVANRKGLGPRWDLRGPRWDLRGASRFEPVVRRKFCLHARAAALRKSRLCVHECVVGSTSFEAGLSRWAERPALSSDTDAHARRRGSERRR